MLGKLHAALDPLSFGNQLLFTPNGPSYTESTAFDRHHPGGRLVLIPSDSKLGSGVSDQDDGIVHRPTPCIFIPPPPPSSSNTPDEETLLVVHFHGTGGDAWKSGGVWFEAAQRAREDHNIAVAVLSVEYPGYGIFPGRPSEPVCNNTAERVMAFLTNSLAIPPSQIVVSGRSMGSGVASTVASVGSYRGLVLISPFTSIHGVLRSFPFGTTVLPRLLKNRFDNISLIPNVPASTRLTVIHGAKDKLISSSQGLDLCKAATHLQQTFVLDPDADHHTMPGLVSSLENVVVSLKRDRGQSRSAIDDATWIEQLKSLSLSCWTQHELAKADQEDHRHLRRVREIAIAGSVVWSIGLPTIQSRLVFVSWSVVLFYIGLMHLRKTKQNAKGEWNNKAFGVLSTSTRYALVTVACRVIFPVLLLKQRNVISAIVVSYLSHVLLR